MGSILIGSPWRTMTSAIRVLVLALLSLMPFRVEAQNSSPPPQTHNQQLLKSEEVDALVAPTLLYPEAFREASVPEVVEDGVTGYMVDSLEEAVSKVDSVISLDRTRVRRRFEQRFTAERLIGAPATLAKSIARSLVSPTRGWDALHRTDSALGMRLCSLRSQRSQRCRFLTFRRCLVALPAPSRRWPMRICDVRYKGRPKTQIRRSAKGKVNHA
jgi:hypothetical protein